MVDEAKLRSRRTVPDLVKRSELVRNLVEVFGGAVIVGGLVLVNHTLAAIVGGLMIIGIAEFWAR